MTPSQLPLLITPQEIEGLRRVEEVLGLPQGKLVRAVILNRTIALLDSVFPPNRLSNRKEA